MQVVGIYKIENIINNKFYIGSSLDIGYRFKAHIRALKHNIHKNKHLQNAVNKYGITNFTFTIIEECNNTELMVREQYYIDKYDINSLYNKTKIAYGGGSDKVEIPLVLLDLKGNIINEYKSGSELARDLKISLAPYATLNTKSILKTKYRVVSKKFYLNNLQEILTWKQYSNETKHKKIVKMNSPKIYKYKLIKDNEILYFDYLKDIGTILSISTERVRQLINNTHKKTGYKILINI